MPSISFTLLHEAAELHLAVPLSILAGKVLIVSLQNVAFITKILNHSAVRKSLAWGGVTGVAPVLWLKWRLAYCPRKERKTLHTSTPLLDIVSLRYQC